MRQFLGIALTWPGIIVSIAAVYPVMWWWERSYRHMLVKVIVSPLIYAGSFALVFGGLWLMSAGQRTFGGETCVFMWGCV